MRLLQPYIFLVLSACASDPPPVDPPASGQAPDVCTVLSTADARILLAPSQRQALLKANMTRCAQPFGVLMAADDRIPTDTLALAARVLAELLDQDMDGVPDDPAVLEAVRNPNVAWLAMPHDPDDWEEWQLPGLQRQLGYDIIIPTWWMIGDEERDNERVKAVIVEEIVHFLTQFGYSAVYPAEFGVDDWTSVIARETQRAQCVFWQHPENDCPGSPAEYRGDCSDPNCDVVEFYQQVLVQSVGMEPGWRGMGFPETREELDGLLSEEIKRVMNEPAFHQLRKPLRFTYPKL
ncbi:MAG: hypothetical protein OSB57_14980 [Planctomycetota bacterium]|nr:hypothetical protein [Planctomycetota bacterium]